MISLEGKVALVTGASRGIGAAVAHSLASHGAHLGLASRSGDDLGIEGAVAAPCDVRRPGDLQSLAAATAERFGGIDILVANAGVGAYGPFLDLPPDQLEEMIDVNVKGTLYAVRAALAVSPGERRRRHRHARVRGRPARASLRGRLLRVKIRPGRLHARDGP